MKEGEVYIYTIARATNSRSMNEVSMSFLPNVMDYGGKKEENNCSVSQVRQIGDFCNCTRKAILDCE